MSTIKIILISLCTSVLVVAGLMVSTKTTEQFGATLGITRYLHSGIAARFLKVTTSTTATVAADGSLTVGGTAFLGPAVLGGNFIQGYGLAVTNYTASSTLTPAQFCSGGTLFTFTGTVSSTLTFPAATTTIATCGAGNGAVGQANFVYVSSTVASVTLTIATSTGMNLKVASGTSNTTVIPNGMIARQDGQIIDAANWFVYFTLYKSPP
jgi:hypothetical protein